MSSSDDRALIKKMSNLLLSGARMLDETCPVCGTPLFYIKDIGLKYCPKCDIYIASPAELKNAKIDKTRVKLLNLEDLKKKKSSQPASSKLNKIPSSIQAELSIDSSKDRSVNNVNKHLLKLMETLLIRLEETIRVESLTPSELIALLERLVDLKKKIENW